MLESTEGSAISEPFQHWSSTVQLRSIAGPLCENNAHARCMRNHVVSLRLMNGCRESCIVRDLKRFGDLNNPGRRIPESDTAQ